MNTAHNFYQRGYSFIKFAVTGGAVATVIFLGTFILTSRANTPHPQANLRIPVPTVPLLPSPSALLRLVSTSATPAADLAPSPEIEEIPATPSETIAPSEQPAFEQESQLTPQPSP